MTRYRRDPACAPRLEARPRHERRTSTTPWRTSIRTPGLDAGDVPAAIPSLFRYATKSRIVIYAWVNDESTRRAYGSKTDAYRLFHKRLAAGDPPTDWADLIERAAPIDQEQEAPEKRIDRLPRRPGRSIRHPDSAHKAVHMLECHIPCWNSTFPVMSNIYRILAEE